MSEDKLGAAAVIIAVVSNQKNIKNTHRRKRNCWIKPWHVRNIAFRINSSLSDVPVFILGSLRYNDGYRNGDVSAAKFYTAHAYIMGLSPNLFTEVRRRREKVRSRVL